jgi:phosphocarrier protein HPr
VAAQIVKTALRHQSRLHITCEGCPLANACSVFELLNLGATRGTALEIIAEGPDEDAALQAIAELFTEGAGI